MINDDDAGICYHNAIMESFYYLVLESQEHKESQKIMWKLLDIGVQRVRKCDGKVNFNSDVETIENNFTRDGELNVLQTNGLN